MLGRFLAEEFGMTPLGLSTGPDCCSLGVVVSGVVVSGVVVSGVVASGVVVSGTVVSGVVVSGAPSPASGCQSGPSKAKS